MTGSWVRRAATAGVLAGVLWAIASSSAAGPKPPVKVPSPVRWLFAYSGRCPNCDATQTIVTGKTPLPSPLPTADARARKGEVRPAPPAANPLDDVAWARLRPLLPVSLRGK